MISSSRVTRWREGESAHCRHHYLLYARATMNPVVNIEETIGKTVGRRRPIDPLPVRASDIADAEAWRRAFGGVRVPRGVFKFHSHEEADAWLMKHLTRPRS